jgi:hypothetical protein
MSLWWSRSLNLKVRRLSGGGIVGRRGTFREVYGTWTSIQKAVPVPRIANLMNSYGPVEEADGRWDSRDASV